MRYFLSLTGLLCLIFFQLLGCSEDTELPTTEVTETEVMVAEAGPAEPTPLTPEAVFERLWNASGGHFGDNEVNFQGLREVTTSPTYLDYLAAAFPTEKRVQTLEAYFQAVPPNPERYTTFLHGWVGAATAEDIAFLHQFIRSQRETEAELFSDLQGGGGKNEAILLAIEKIFRNTREPATQDFIRRYNISEDEFISRAVAFHNTLAKEDSVWLGEQMETHGTDTGLVWSAIYRPALIGEILTNFDSLSGLHAWVDAKRSPAN